MTKKILIVEDTPEALENLKELLAMEGFEIITAANGEEAMYKFYLYTPDVIITDLRMPKMDGLALIDKIKKSDQLKNIPIIVFSANDTPEYEVKSLKLGANVFLKKPCSIEKLLDTIQSLLSMPSRSS
jgi:DNA-binding response OmpR family regulator